MIAILLTLAIVTASQRTIEVYVDVIEYNCVFDKYGNRTISQIIFWEINPATGKLQVRSWTMADGERPTRYGKLTRYEYRADGVQYHVRSPMYRESWTHHDAERDNLSVHPVRNAFPAASKWIREHMTATP